MPEQPEVSFDAAYAAAGGVYGQEPVPYPLTYEYAKKQCIQRERILRLQFDDDKLDPADEAVLATLSVDDPSLCWRRWDYLKALWHVMERGYQRSTEEKDLAARLILSREPVYARIAGRVVPVTSRGRRAMICMARHERMRRSLGEDLDAITARLTKPMSRRRRKLHLAVAERIDREWENQFRGIIANALTPDGRAALPEEAPPWWGEITAEDEERLALALLEAGPGRFGRTGRPPKSRDSSTKEPEFGIFESVLAAWEGRLQLPPAALADMDVAQFSVWVRAGGQAGSDAASIEKAFAA